MNTGIARDRKNLLIGLVLLAVLLVFGFTSGDSVLLLLGKISIMALFAMSLNLQVGLAGLQPLGHSLFFGLGCYSYAIFVSKLGVNPYLAVLLALAVTFVLSLFVSFLLVRRSDVLSFTFLSMGLCTLAYTAVLKIQFVGMDAGMSNVPGLPFAAGIRPTYFLIVAVVAVMIFLIYLYLKSPFSWLLRACRDNRHKSECIGINIPHVRLIGVTVSNMFACVAGILMALRNNGAYTSSIAVQLSFEGLIMCLLGGLNSFWGPCLGAAIVTFFNTQITNLTLYTNFFLGILTMAVVFFLKGGILDPELEYKLRKLGRKLRKPRADSKGGTSNE